MRPPHRRNILHAEGEKEKLIKRRKEIVPLREMASQVRGGIRAVYVYAALRLMAGRRRRVRCGVYRLGTITDTSREALYHAVKTLQYAGWIRVRRMRMNKGEVTVSEKTGKLWRKMIYCILLTPMSRIKVENEAQKARHKWETMEYFLKTDGCFATDEAHKEARQVAVKTVVAMLRAGGFVVPRYYTYRNACPLIRLRENTGYRIIIEPLGKDSVYTVLERRSLSDDHWYEVRRYDLGEVAALAGLREQIINDALDHSSAVPSRWGQPVPPQQLHTRMSKPTPVILEETEL